MEIEEVFAHISDADKVKAVEGFVKINPHMRGIDFDTMMEIILDHDAHMPVIGDVVLDKNGATKLVLHFIACN